MDRKQPPSKDRSNVADRNNTARERRSGEGSDSALANLRNIERDRQQSKPAEDDGSGK